MLERSINRVKLGSMLHHGIGMHQRRSSLLAESSVSLSRYVDTMALLRPSHCYVSSGHSGTEAILGPDYFCVPKLFNPLSECFLSASRPCKHLSKLTAVVNDDLGLGGTGGGTVGLDLLDNVDAVDDLAEDDVLAVQPRSLLSTDEELGAVARRYVRLIKACGDEVAYVLGPALAMERIPGPVCFRVKFSSLNFSP